MLTKEVVLDRLGMMLLDGSVSLPHEWAEQTARSAIALINSADVTETEKLRQRVLELEARDGRIEATFTANVSPDPVAWISDGNSEQSVRIHHKRPVAKPGGVPESSTYVVVFRDSFAEIEAKVPRGSLRAIPLYAGPPETIS